MQCRLFIIAVMLLVSFSIHAKGQNQYPELPKFYEVSERLYRGAQPRPGGIRRLSDLGVNTIINLRGANSQTRADEAEAKSLGLKYYRITLPIWGRPNDADIRRILEIITAPESGRVFIHCRDGIDRTGMITALYLIKNESWTTEMATAEAARSGMRRNQYWMRDYIRDFNRQQQGAGEDFDDKIGTGVRVGERVVLTVKKKAVRWFGDVF